jgi:hypothetical protein
MSGLAHIEGDAHRLARHLGRVAAISVVGWMNHSSSTSGWSSTLVLHPGVPDDIAAGQQDRPHAEAPALPVLDERGEGGARTIRGAQA